MLSQVIGSVVPVVRLPVTLLQGAESVIEQLTHVIARAATLVDAAEHLPSRVEAVVARAEAASAAVDELVGRADDVTARLAGVVAEAAGTLATLSPLAAGLGTVRPEALPQLLDDLTTLRPAIATLESLVPVVAQLGVQVDHLDATVADVGALLSGIPGAARLRGRGGSRPAP